MPRYPVPMTTPRDDTPKPRAVNREVEQADFVREQFVTLFLKQNKRAQTGLLVCVVLIFFLLINRLPGWLPYAWLVGAGVISGARFSLTDRLVRGSDSPLWMIATMLLLNGLLLMLPVLAFGRFSDVDRAFISIVLMATATASVATTSGYRGIFLWFAAPMLVSLSLAWIILAPPGQAQWVERGMGGLIAAYLGFLFGLGRDAFRVFDESCRIRFAERALNSRLTFALEDARQASQAKTRFLAAASHDLRQPLHTIGVLLAAMGLRKLDERSREIVQMLGVVSQSLSAQLDGLLDVSKLDAGVVKPDLQTHRIDEIVAAHVAAIEASASERGLYVRAHCDEPAYALTDLHLIQRLLGNLTSNALKFTSVGGVDVFVRQGDGHVVVEVVDTGMGIAAEHQRLVFQEFYQIGNTERDRSNGLGLGLAIVQRVCALLGIDLSLESTLNQGSRFTLRLPLVERPRRERPTDPPITSAVPPSLTVLVVDDEADIREGMRFLLEELGCRALLADGVAQAGEQARTHNIDMVISDFRLRNQESGFDAIHQVQALHPGAYALLISGDTAPDRLQQAQRAGFPLLHKPVALGELLKHIHKARPRT